MKHQNIQQQIEQTLNSLDGLQKAEANPYLYTRIEQRLKNKQPANYESTFYRLAWALIIFIALNVFTYIRISGNNQSAIKTGIESFAAEYGLQQTTINL